MIKDRCLGRNKEATWNMSIGTKNHTKSGATDELGAELDAALAGVLVQLRLPRLAAAPERVVVRALPRAQSVLPEHGDQHAGQEQPRCYHEEDGSISGFAYRWSMGYFPVQMKLQVRAADWRYVGSVE
jgi:hypothetical protein